MCLTQHSNFIGFSAGTVAGGIVLAVLLYMWGKFYRKVTMVRRVDGSNPIVISPERKGKNIVLQINSFS